MSGFFEIMEIFVLVGGLIFALLLATPDYLKRKKGLENNEISE